MPALSDLARARPPMPYLDALNDAQRRAVEMLDGPLLVLAGAGTGKTRALTARIAHILTLGRARPDQILAVTFTNKAAREMKERVAALIAPLAPAPDASAVPVRRDHGAAMPWMGTFHSMSVRILRRHAELAGLKPNFTILDTDDQLRLLKDLVRGHNIDDKRWPPRLLAGIIEGWKNRAWTPERVPAAEASAYDGRGVALYHEYQERLRTLNAVDFGDLLLYCVDIFRAHADVLARYQERFRFILVDEYQDTNAVQYLWLRLLAAGHQNICCVGDDDQSIYGWRGAEVDNILRFEKDFPGAHVVRLEQNYRSTPHILAAASALIAGNRSRLGKTLWTELVDGEKVRLIGHWDSEEEARWIGEEIESLQSGTRGLDPVALNDQAILVRAGHQMKAFEDRFLAIGLPYRVIGGPRFYERQEIRDALAYFRLAVSPDDGLAFERVVNTPRRGVGPKTLQGIQRAARDDGTTLVEATRRLVDGGDLRGKAGTALRQFIAMIDRWHGAVDAVRAAPDALIEPLFPDTPARDDLSHVRLAELILEESGYVSMWQNDRSPDAPGRLDNLKELVKGLEDFANLQGFLEHVSLIMDNDTTDVADKVTIMTLHAAKGSEYPVVFLPGWEEGLFPSQRTLDEQGVPGLEEERRLAYVGITRARRLCIISFASNRRVYGQWQAQMPSRFVDELPSAHVEVLTPPGLSGGGYGAAAPAMAVISGAASEIEERASHADVYDSPGWRRMQRRLGQSHAGAGRSAPGAPARRGAKRRKEAAASRTWEVGERVFHVKFGYGQVLIVDGDKLEVAFDKAGTKRLVADFVRPADAAESPSQ